MSLIIHSHFRCNIELKKVTGKYILKSTLTPKSMRKQLEEQRAPEQRSFSSTPHLGSTSSSLPDSLTLEVGNLLLYSEILFTHQSQSLDLVTIIFSSTILYTTERNIISIKLYQVIYKHFYNLSPETDI